MLVINAVVTSTAVQTGVAVIATARLNSTTQKMKAIEEALMAYRTASSAAPATAGSLWERALPSVAGN